MATESIYDLVVDELLSRQKMIKEELRERFKGAKPFRQEPVSRKELIMDYDEMLRNEAYLRENFGDDIFNESIMNLQSKIRGGVKNA